MLKRVLFFIFVQFSVDHSILLRKLIPTHFSIGITGNVHGYKRKLVQKRRTKRNASPLDEIAERKRLSTRISQTDELKKINENNDNHERYDKNQMNDDVNYNYKTKQLKTIKSDDYRDYAFDTTDTDQFNENDDLLKRYYTYPVRRAAAFTDLNSFSDLMHFVAGQDERADQYVKRLHYGNDDGFLNDESNDNDSDISEYDEYDDDY